MSEIPPGTVIPGMVALSKGSGKDRRWLVQTKDGRIAWVTNEQLLAENRPPTLLNLSDAAAVRWVEQLEQEAGEEFQRHPIDQTPGHFPHPEIPKEDQLSPVSSAPDNPPSEQPMQTTSKRQKFLNKIKRFRKGESSSPRLFSDPQPQDGGEKPGKGKRDSWLEGLPQIYLWILLAAILIAIGVAIVFNCQPFIKMTQIIFDSAGFFQLEAWWASSVAWIGVGLATLIGIIWYLVGQMIECAPTIMTVSDKRTLRMINAISYAANVRVQPSDNADVAWLKDRYNNRPIASLRFFRRARLVAYTNELVVCWIVAPPAEGTPINFFLYLITGQFDRIDWGNVFLMLSVLLLIEKLTQAAINVYGHLEAEKKIQADQRG